MYPLLLFAQTTTTSPSRVQPTMLDENAVAYSGACRPNVDEILSIASGKGDIKVSMLA